MISEIDAAIFDMDGVIVDNHRYHLLAWEKFCDKHNLIFDKKKFTKQYFGKNNNDILTGLFGKELPNELIQKLGEEKEADYRELYRNDIKALEGLIEFMKHLKSSSKKIAIASSAPRSNINFVIEHTKIQSYIDVVVDGNMIKRGKPNPDIFLTAAGKLGTMPEKCVVFEDSFAGIEAAKRAGIKVIAVATTHSKEEHDKTIPIITDFTCLLK